MKEVEEYQRRAEQIWLARANGQMMRDAGCPWCGFVDALEDDCIVEERTCLDCPLAMVFGFATRETYACRPFGPYLGWLEALNGPEDELAAARVLYDLLVEHREAILKAAEEVLGEISAG